MHEALRRAQVIFADSETSGAPAASRAPCPDVTTPTDGCTSCQAKNAAVSPHWPNSRKAVLEALPRPVDNVVQVHRHTSSHHHPGRKVRQDVGVLDGVQHQGLREPELRPMQGMDAGVRERVQGLP